MRFERTVSVWAVSVLAIGLSTAAVADHDKGLLKELEAIGDTYAKALVANDTETMFGMYVDDAISLPNFGKRLDGLAAMKAHHAQMMAAGTKIVSFESEPTDAWNAGDQVVEIGKYHIKLMVPGMGPIEDRGKYLNVYVRGGDGSLKVKVETWATDVDPATMMGGGDHGHEGHGHDGHGHDGHEGHDH